MSEPVIRIDSLKKKFGTKVVLDQHAISFHAGVHFIVGPNGSGKTTFFKSLAGIHPFEGKVVLQGKVDLHRDRMNHRKMVSYCPAEPLFPEYLNGTELLAFVCATRGIPLNSTQPLTEAFGMDGYLRDKVGVYSSGMKKKLGLVMALAGFVPVIMLDEPYSALDQPSRKVLAGMIRQGQAKGCSFLIASHLADLHAAFGDGKVYKMEGASLHAMKEGEPLPWLETESPLTENLAGERE